MLDAINSRSNGETLTTVQPRQGGKPVMPGLM